MTTVLTFHRVVDRLGRDHDLSWEGFRSIVDALASSTVDLDHPGSSHDVAMTFDDGTDDHLRAAAELRRRGLSGVFFIPTGQVGTAGHLDAAQVRELVATGHVVGSHAVDHHPLAGIPVGGLRYQVRESRLRLEEICDTPIRYFAPPGGIRHAALRQALESEDYRACRSMRWGIYRDPTDRWEIPCVPVTEYTWQKGWVLQALDRHSLPVAMKLGSVAKRLLPAGISQSIRAGLHDPLRQRGGRSTGG
jgi:peptidoglycan/xylan/chitin deacetylase (PgdA/CDA1 family)